MKIENQENIRQKSTYLKEVYNFIPEKKGLELLVQQYENCKNHSNNNSNYHDFNKLKLWNIVFF